MHRRLTAELVEHYQNNRQMVFLSGPRQVGKTTVAKALSSERGDYLNWDNHDHRQLILSGTQAVAEHMGLNRLTAQPPVCAFDELHKYPQWRDFVKGLFDQYETQADFLITGSASLKTFSRGGDSLMGRYFPYTLHPLSVAEFVNSSGDLIDPAPKAMSDEEWQALWRFGGFPEPLLKADDRFYTRWRKLRTEQLFREDLRDLTQVRQLDQIEMMARMLLEQTGQLTSYSYLAKSVRVSVDTIRRWISTLESLFYCFKVSPWHKNVSRALRKEPKYYLWDWSQVKGEGTRAESMVASALLKAVNWWTETGQGEFGLHFIRDKQQREMDFLVTKNAEPWFLVAVKTSAKAKLSESLAYFQRQTGARHAFQVAMDSDFVERDCFSQTQPIIVPARTFLAQLV